jgi:hypothetical protein
MVSADFAKATTRQFLAVVMQIKGGTDYGHWVGDVVLGDWQGIALSDGDGSFNEGAGNHMAIRTCHSFPREVSAVRHWKQIGRRSMGHDVQRFHACFTDFRDPTCFSRTRNSSRIASGKRSHRPMNRIAAFFRAKKVSSLRS